MTFTEFLDIIADDNGTISWHQALLCAGNHGLNAEFDTEYGPLAGERVDAGELAVWLGY